MKLGVTLDILNQKDTPAFYADTLANRPAAGFTGRVFISTDTLDLYRDTGTTWVLLSPSSTGTITGSGAAGQVSYFSGASSIAGSNDLFFDSVNGHLGIGTITPSTALTIFHDQNQIIQINQTTATNDTKIAFQNSGTPLWRIGNSYNAGANDWGIFDVVGSIQPLTIKKTTGQTFVGSQTTSSGLLVVNSSTADNHIVAIGANSPSIRVRNAGTSPTQQFGLGLATATNNFIQGSVSGDFCVFNGSTTASPIIFGVYDGGAGNVQPAVEISPARNLLVGTLVDAGFKADINGTARIQNEITVNGTGTNTIDRISINRSGSDARINALGGGNLTLNAPRVSAQQNVFTSNTIASGTSALILQSGLDNAGITELQFKSTNAGTFLARFFTTGNFGINQNTDAGFRLDVNGTARVQGVITGSVASGTLTMGAAATNQAAIAITGFFPNTGTINTSNGNQRSFAAAIGGQQVGYSAIFNGNNQGVTTTSYYFNATGAINITAGTSIINGFNFEPTLTSEVNTTINAFTSNMNAASNRWNLFISGTAQNYLAGALSIGVTTANASALLQIDSTTRGFLPPRMTTAQKNAIGTPATGLVIYDTTLNKLAVFTGVNWETVTSV